MLAGTFQYRSPAGCELMTPGSLFLGNAGDSFTCGHEHGAGDRCLSFSYTPDFFERLASDSGTRRLNFHAPRIPPIRALSPLVAEASALLAGVNRLSFEELSVKLAAQAIELDRGIAPSGSSPGQASLARVTRVVRLIESDPDIPQCLAGLARMARLSPYHFLRTFEGLTGTTPHQYLLRIRLRRAALRLRAEPAKILDVRARLRLRRRLEFQPRLSRRIRPQPPRLPFTALTAPLPRNPTSEIRNPSTCLYLQLISRPGIKRP